MASSTTTPQQTNLSSTLKTISLTKTKQLSKLRADFLSAKAELLDRVDNETIDISEKVEILLTGVKRLVPDSNYEGGELENVKKWIFQAQFDGMVNEEMMEGFEMELKEVLERRERVLEGARVWGELVGEFLDGGEEFPVGADDDGEEFEIVEKDRLRVLRERFENVVFEGVQIDEGGLQRWLEGLFDIFHDDDDDDDDDEDVLESFKDEVRGLWREAGRKNYKHFDEASLKWCLKGLIGNEMVSEERKLVLREILNDKIVGNEVAGVLNLRMMELFGGWGWDLAGGRGLRVEPKRQGNGKWRVCMEEEVLDSVLLYYVGMILCVRVRGRFEWLVRRVKDLRGGGEGVSREVLDRRRFFLDEDQGDGWDQFSDEKTVEEMRKELFEGDFWMNGLPKSVYDGAGGYDGDENIEDEDEDDEDGNDGRKKKSGNDIKQQLLRVLATEIEVQKAIHGEVAVVQSDFKWFGTSLPHSTIFAVLRFMGFEDNWIEFFRVFLEAPLDMGPTNGVGIEGEGKKSDVKIRKRGVPMSHALEKVLTEVVLFWLDMKVSQNGKGAKLLRFHDDLWVIGNPKKCAEAWEIIKDFTSIMELELNEAKTGSVHLTQGDFTFEDSEISARLPVGTVAIGFLILDPKTGEWIINQEDVDKHVVQLSKQLQNCRGVLEWVQTWNSCIGRFFGHTFGEPANCLGRRHVDSILQTQKKIQEKIFDGGNVSEFLKKRLREKFGFKDLTDAFIFLPESLGGLGVKNPFVGPLLVRDGFRWKEPEEVMKVFLEKEKRIYGKSKKEFEGLSNGARKRRFRIVFSDGYGTPGGSDEVENLKEFMSFEEFSKHRESLSRELGGVYAKMMEEPNVEGVRTSTFVEEVVRDLKRLQPEISKRDEEEEVKWILAMFEKELKLMFGGLRLVEKELLPLGILTILRRRRVAWEMVL